MVRQDDLLEVEGESNQEEGDHENREEQAVDAHAIGFQRLDLVVTVEQRYGEETCRGCQDGPHEVGKYRGNHRQVVVQQGGEDVAFLSHEAVELEAEFDGYEEAGKDDEAGDVG